MANTGAGNAGEAKNSEQLEVRKVERDPILAEINRKIVKAFEGDGNQTVDVR